MWRSISTEGCQWPQPGCANKQMAVDLLTEGAFMLLSRCPNPKRALTLLHRVSAVAPLE